jgi:hypothetical protein
VEQIGNIEEQLQRLKQQEIEGERLENVQQQKQAGREKLATAGTVLAFSAALLSLLGRVVPASAGIPEDSTQSTINTMPAEDSSTHIVLVEDQGLHKQLEELLKHPQISEKQKVATSGSEAAGKGPAIVTTLAGKAPLIIYQESSTPSFIYRGDEEGDMEEDYDVHAYEGDVYIFIVNEKLLPKMFKEEDSQ